MRLLLLLIILVPAAVDAQTGLVFTKKQGREVLYKQGDLITFRSKGNTKGITTQIKDFDFETDELVFTDLRVKIKDITHVHLDSKNKNWWFMKHKWGTLFLIVGTSYFALDAINNGEVTKETAAFSAACVGTGILAKVLISKWIPIGGKKKLKLIRLID